MDCHLVGFHPALQGKRQSIRPRMEMPGMEMPASSVNRGRLRKSTISTMLVLTVGTPAQWIRYGIG